MAPSEHYVMASEEQVVNQFRGTSAPELLNADAASLISVCKRIEQDPSTFPILNMPDRKVLEATMQRMRMLGMLDDPWAANANAEVAIKIAAVLSREDSLCAMQVLEVHSRNSSGICSGKSQPYWGYGPIPVEWLIERDWRVRTHWEDN